MTDEEYNKQKQENFKKHHDQREMYKKQLLVLLQISGYDVNTIYSPVHLIEALDNVGFIKIKSKYHMNKQNKREFEFPLQFSMNNYEFEMDVGIQLKKPKANFSINGERQWLDIWYKRLYECLKGNEIKTDLEEW